jgi:hypothetical protein
METIAFLVQGSSDEPYNVTFHKSEKSFSALCTCAAGENGQWCKHRLRILEGSPEGIVCDDDIELVLEKISTIAAWLPGTKISEAMVALAKAEHEFEQAKKIITAAKKNLSVAMRP